MKEPKKMRSPKLAAIGTSLDGDAFNRFVDGADPMNDDGQEQHDLPKPWEGLPSTPKARLMLLLDPADKKRLDFLSEQTGRSAQVILRRYIESALRNEADEVYKSID